MRYLLHFYLLLVAAVALSGCNTSTSITTTQKSPLNTPSPVLLTSTSTKSPRPTKTIIPSTSTPTLTPTQPVTPTPLPTLEPEKAQEILKTWLQGWEICLAPCFWNIIPGQTTLDEAINIFAHLGLQMELTNEREGKAFYEIIYDFESGLSVSPLLTVQGELIKNLSVYITGDTSLPGVPREWLAYSPETLISQYGLPSQVDFFMGRNRDNDAPPSAYYDMVLYFEIADLIVLYNGSDIRPPISSPNICPLIDSFALVRIYLGKNPEHPPPEGVALEDATSMSIEEFAALMKGDNENACFDLNQGLFP